MIAWWEKLSPRERALIAGAGALLALILVLQFILVPLAQNRSAARLKADQAARTLDLMTSRGLSAGAAAGSAGLALDADARRRAILDTATRRGLAIARVQVSEDGVVTVQVDDAGAENVFAWLFDLKRNTGLEVSKATMNEAGAGLVRSSFEFGGATGG